MAGVLTATFLLWNDNDFDETILDTDNIINHIQELSSGAYEGRLAGSDGDGRALKYIEDHFRELDIEPAGVEGTYYQPFSVMIPKIDTEPTFKVVSDDGKIIRELIMYEDYNALPSMNGGSIDFSGELVYLGSDLLRTDPELIRNRIVIIEANRLLPKHQEYVIQAGGEGILLSADTNIFGRQLRYASEKFLNVEGKTGQSILTGYISNEAYRDLRRLVEGGDKGDEKQTFPVLGGVRIKVDMGFPIVDTANIMGKIEGKGTDGSVLLISANIDGLGEGTDGKYFPGVVNYTSGIATILEVARVMASQESIPYQTVVFVGWNGQQQQLAGSSHYIDYPVFPMESSSLIHLEGLGKKSLEGIKISAHMANGAMLKDRVLDYSQDADLRAVEDSSITGVINQFNDSKAPAVLLRDTADVQDTYDDTIENIERDTLENSALVLLNHIKRDIYRDRGFDYLTIIEKVLVAIVTFSSLVSYFIVAAYNREPNRRVFGRTLESIYYSTPAVLLRKGMTLVVSLFIAIFMLSLLANIDPGTDVRTTSKGISSNFSLYLTIKRSVIYIRTMLSPGSYQLTGTGNIFQIIYNSSKQSIMLISASLLISTFLGILRGMYEGYRSRKSRLGSLGTLVFFSIPDVLIVLFTLLGYIFVFRKMPIVGEMEYIKGFLLPLFTLSIIPTIYISRITFITVQGEMGKDYTRNAMAKGFSRRKTVFTELAPAVLFKIVDTMPAIMTMLLTNMIVVEWLFNYQGILYYLLYFNSRQDVYRFVPLAVVLGLVYVTATMGFQFIARLINPLKTRRANK
ncbi:MAG TPA: M28 family peptidase [Tissierellaceae bacterium]|nr:M28 family peptidase [Tissierellaceae bacterium]